MRLLFAMLVLAVGTPALAGEFEYGTFRIIETSMTVKSYEAMLVVRFDTASGVAFLCKESYDASEGALNRAWNNCAIQLAKVQGTAKDTDLASVAPLVYEPLMLSLLGRKGWELVSHNDQTKEITKNITEHQRIYLLTRAAR